METEGDFTIEQLMLKHYSFPMVVNSIPSKDSQPVFPDDTDLLIDVVRDVDFIRVKIVDDVNNRDTPTGISADSKLRDGLINKEFLIPVKIDKKLQFIHRAAEYKTINEVLDDNPRFIQVLEKVSPSRISDWKTIEENTKLELKWVYQKQNGELKRRYLKCTSGKNIYNLEETLQANMKPVADPKSYTIDEISRFAILPALVRFVSDEDNALCQSSVPSVTRAIFGGPVELLHFETNDIVMAVTEGTYSNSLTAAVVPQNLCKRERVIVKDSSNEIYSNMSFTSDTLNKKVNTSLYCLPVDTSSQELVWIDENAREFSSESTMRQTPKSKGQKPTVPVKPMLKGTAQEKEKTQSENSDYEDVEPVCISSVHQTSSKSKTEEHTEEEESAYENIDEPKRHLSNKKCTEDNLGVSTISDSFYIDLSMDSVTEDSENYECLKYNDDAISETLKNKTDQEKPVETIVEQDMKFEELTVQEVHDRLKQCSLHSFADLCLEQRLDGAFLKEMDLNLFKEPPFSLSPFEIMKLKRIVQMNWMPKI